MSEKKRFKPQDLGPLAEKGEVPDSAAIEAHKGYLIVVWRSGKVKHSGFVGPDGTWQISK